jgi:hypothetical protein
MKKGSKPEPNSETWRLSTGNRKPPSITLPRIRALETPEPDDPQKPDGRPFK